MRYERVCRFKEGGSVLKNSRVKKIKLTNIKTGSWKVVGLYGDGAALSQIDVRSLAFTEEANILEIEMLEVYSGTKYNDLCIQAIIPCFTDTVTDGFNN